MRKTNQNEPINQFLHNNRKRKPISFHMPGHKYRYFGNSNAKAYDITEIFGADNIKNPGGIIKGSLENISKIYGTEKSFYLTNGTTAGIHSIMRYAALKSKKMILSRDCHISAVNGAILFGVDIIFIPIEYEKGIPLPVAPERTAKVIEENPDACGILITSPNYYGKTADILTIADLAHNKGMFLAVDEAHGAHFKFARLFDLSGVGNGADIVCHSLHKTLPVYNQGAVLHVCSDRIDYRQIAEAVNMQGTTSPSYPLLASMEKAVVYFNNNQNRLYKKLKKNVKHLGSILNKGIIETDDYTRMIIKTSMGGFEAARMLHEKYSIDVEASDFEHIICIATPFNKKRDFVKLAKSLRKMGNKIKKVGTPNIPGIQRREISVSDAYSLRKKTVPLNMAVGCICGTIIMSYPPGTPLLCPGEMIDADTVEYVKKVQDAGGSVLGIEDNKIPILERI